MPHIQSPIRCVTFPEFSDSVINTKFIINGIEWLSYHVWYSTKDQRFPDFIRIFVSYVPLIDNTARVSLENLRIIVLSLPDLVLGCTGL